MTALSLFNIAGTINSLFVLFSIYGVFLQLTLIWQRAQQHCSSTTELLSLNQFTVTFFAYFSFFVYGYSVEPFNHYMVWPRLMACCLVFLILFEMFKDRNQLRVRIVFGLVGISLILGLIGLLVGPKVADESHLISTVLILTVSGALAQGYWHQIRLIVKHGKTGAVNIKMNQYILAMDFSTLFLAYTMGFENSWPMVVLATVSGLTKAIIMYLFRWVRISPIAASRRQVG
ncbi:hypothetical protein FLL45_00630 [Aliikangiella marina]|uniref:Uncharacterized protein n=1 Tax=Aliikangiella marina TaxID=1712262 RepID=A0A545TH79_9GAMM|nr:hypothetical protein [Aliikangiella marina]TQV76501.1 hypothetical protein FLL45_00630 [Aliikangiella marina]